jgi:hypothetical protein
MAHVSVSTQTNDYIQTKHFRDGHNILEPLKFLFPAALTLPMRATYPSIITLIMFDTDYKLLRVLYYFLHFPGENCIMGSFISD